MAGPFDDYTQDEYGLGFASATPETSLVFPSATTSTNTGPDAHDFAATQAPQIAQPQFNMEAAGLSFASPTQPRTQSDKEYLESLPPAQKIGLALQTFGAAMEGRPSPVDELLKRRREIERENRADLKSTIDTISKGNDILRKMPPGIARDAVATALGKAVGGGELAEVFKATGDLKQETDAVLSTFTDPDVQNQLLKSCSGSNDFRACVMKQANDKDFMDRAHSMADSKRMAGIVTKLGAVRDQLAKTNELSEFKGADGKYDIPFAKLIELNSKAKIFTDAEMDTMRRNEDMLSPFGIRTTSAIKAGAAERAKQAEKPVKEWSDPYNLNGATVQKNLATGEIRTAVSRAPREPSEELTAAQKFKLRRETAAYDNAVEQMKKFSIGADGASTDQKVQERLTPTVTTKYGSEKNPKFDPQFAGRVKAWAKLTEAGDPREREGVGAGAGTEAKAPAPAAVPKAEPKPAPAADKGKATTLSDADKKAAIDAATAAVNKGADPEIVKKRLREKYGIIVSFTQRQ